MAPKTPIFEGADAFLDHFKALAFEAKKIVLAGCQADMEQTIAERLAALDAERAELMALTGKPAENGRGEETRSRPKATIVFYNPETGDTSTGRGGWKSTPWVKAVLDAGGDMERYRVGPNNPLPEHLQGGAPAAQ